LEQDFVSVTISVFNHHIHGEYREQIVRVMQSIIGVIVAVFLVGYILYAIFVFLIEISGFNFGSYNPSYKWGADFGKKKREKVLARKQNPPTHAPIVKSRFGLDLETRWMDSRKDSLRIEADGECIISDTKKDLVRLGFHIAQDEKVLSTSHYHHMIRAGGKSIKKKKKVVINLEVEELSKSQGAVVSISVYFKDDEVRMLVLESVKQLLWQ
jgi:hypothetical protein